MAKWSCKYSLYVNIHKILKSEVAAELRNFFLEILLTSIHEKTLLLLTQNSNVKRMIISPSYLISIIIYLLLLKQSDSFILIGDKDNFSRNKNTVLS